MKKYIILLALAAILNSCGEGQNKPMTQDDIVANVIRHQFDSLALNCELISLTQVDTLFKSMPDDDSVYLALANERERICGLILERFDKYKWGSEPTSDSDLWDSIPDADSVLALMREYKMNYKGPLEWHVYQVIVKSDSYELKKDIESRLYLVNPTLTRVHAVTPQYLQLREKSKNLEDFFIR